MNHLSVDSVETMTSSQLAKMLNFSSVSSINKAIRKMFDDSKMESLVKTVDYRGYVVEYHLPELESKMFVAKHDISYLEKITQYWIDKNKPKAIDDNNQLLALAHGVIRLQGELEEAKRTKAHINDKRTATLMGKAGADAKRIKKLESQLKYNETHITVLKAGLTGRVDIGEKKNAEPWRVLKQWSIDEGFEIKKMPDPRYPEGINMYHVDLIDRFKRLYM